MSPVSRQALFYPPEKAAFHAAEFRAMLDEEPRHRVELEAGQPAVREQGVPFLRGCDEIVVDAAELDLAQAPRTVGVKPAKAATGEKGVLITFAEESRLARIVAVFDRTFGGGPTNADVERLVLRPAARSGSGYTIGAPVYALPPFAAGMFGPLLGGMRVESTNGSQKTIAFPAVAGGAFLVQVAKGDQPTRLVAQDVAVDVTQAEIETVPKDLAIEIAAAGTSLPVWSHPGPLLPGLAQTVTFRPMAEKLLNERLAAAAAAGGPPPATLAVSLRFTSASASAVSITSPSLDATYRARPSDQPRRLELRGGYERLAIDAPAAVAPFASSLTLAAKFLGRELNGGYEPAPDAVAPSGLRVHPARSAAALVPLLPLAGSPEGSPLALASLRLGLAATVDSEIAVEFHADAAGAPGALLAPPNVRQLAALFSGWTEVVLPSPASIATGGRALWVVLRATHGEVLWLGDRGMAVPALVSTDGGAAWGEPSPLLAGALSPRVQLFHAVPTPETIAVELRGEGIRHVWTLARTEPGSVQFASQGASLPPSAGSLLVRATGGARATTELSLFSRSAIDLTLDALTLSYKPFQLAGA